MAFTKRSRRSDPVTDNFFDDAAELPRADVGTSHKGARTRTFYRRLFFGSLAMLALTALMLTIVMINSMGVAGTAEGGGETPEEEQPVAMSSALTNLIGSPGRFAATTYVESWLENVPEPLPGGRLVSWDGSTVLTRATDEAPETETSDGTGTETIAMENLEEAPVTGYDTTLEHFTLVDGLGRGYTADVHMAIDPRGGAKVLAGPSLTILTPNATDDWVETEMWPGLEDGAEVTEAVQASVNNWAAAYTSGDPARLRQATGDPDENNTYLPLSGVENVSAEVANAAAMDNSEMLLRVQLTLEWEGRAEVSGTRVPVVMDLLMQKTDTASPMVVAWGAPGTGPKMEPYSNAVPLVEREDISGAVPTEEEPEQQAPSEAEATTEAPTKSPEEGDEQPAKDDPETSEEEGN